MRSHLETIEGAKTEFLRAKAMISRALETTPDDRINWSPSATARTPLQQVAHAAQAIKSVQETLSGRPFPIKTTAEADKFFREWEQQFTTREAVLELLEQNSAEYVCWLDALTPEALTTNIEMLFGLGTVPMTTALGFASNHTVWHAAQIAYIQTIYGDHAW